MRDVIKQLEEKVNALKEQFNIDYEKLGYHETTAMELKIQMSKQLKEIQELETAMERLKNGRY
jgi:hypothetical protein